LLSPFTANLLALYTASVGTGVTPEIEPILTICPPPRASMPGATACVIRIMPATLVSMTLIQSVTAPASNGTLAADIVARVVDQDVDVAPVSGEAVDQRRDRVVGDIELQRQASRTQAPGEAGEALAAPRRRDDPAIRCR